MWYNLLFRSVSPETSPGKKFGIPLVSRVSPFSEGAEIRMEFLKLLQPFLIPLEDSQNDDVDTCDTDDRDLGTESANMEKKHQHTDSTNMLKDCEIHMDEPVKIANVSNAVNVLVSWPKKMLKYYNTALLNSLPKVCRPAFLLKKPQESVALYDCLDAFLKEEPLGPDDMWCET